LQIAAQLTEGVSFEHILDKVRDSVGDELKRIHILTRKDITNIKQCFKIKKIERHTDDATGVSAWVDEMRSHPDNLVIVYKHKVYNKQKI
jgi:hypothetical protein